MSDLISRSALLAKIGNVRRVTEYDESGCGMEYSALPEWAVMLAPAVDAVPVVRCGECKHRENPDICPLCDRVWRVRIDEDGSSLWEISDRTVFDGFCHMGAKMDGGA